jgi:hypothetical protein
VDDRKNKHIRMVVIQCHVVKIAWSDGEVQVIRRCEYFKDV